MSEDKKAEQDVVNVDEIEESEESEVLSELLKSIETGKKEEDSKAASADLLQELIDTAQGEIELEWELAQAAKVRRRERPKQDLAEVLSPSQGSEGRKSLVELTSRDDASEGDGTEKNPPNTLFVCPLDLVLFPHMTVPVFLLNEHLRKVIEQSEPPIEYVAFLMKKEPKQDATSSNLYRVGTVAKVLRTMRLPDGTTTAIVQTLKRCKVDKFLRKDPYLIARVQFLEEEQKAEDLPRIEALGRNLHQLLVEASEFSPQWPQEADSFLEQRDSPSKIADFVCIHFLKEPQKRQQMLEVLDLRQRLEQALGVLLREVEMLKLQRHVREEVEAQAQKGQRDYMLREQLKLIRRELGEEIDEKELDVENYQDRISAAGMSQEAEERALEELRRLSVLVPEAAEYNIIRTYLDWLCDLPWSVYSEDKIHLKQARNILEEDHYGLEKVKERILEFLAVRKLKPDQKGAILCLSGPPGVGKTSLGKSIAQAMGREFFRFSLGGMRDEAEIKGHRRTYIGAMPGKIMQGLKRIKTSNPVFMLDEIDKISQDWRGDPASALLEVLDPAQNSQFLDHYVDVPFDLSHVMFIATANYPDAIPAPLLDRMEVIHLPGYIPEEKVEIARRFLLPRQREEHGLKGNQLQISKGAFLPIVLQYTRESGVRNLERALGKICRKVATQIAEALEEETELKRRVISEKNLEEVLGPPAHLREEMTARKARIGSAVGLAWTPTGGEILFIEATSFAGKKGTLQLTGKLGEVMNESSRIALSYLKSKAERYHIPMELFEEREIHLHVPAGAVPKDGPSAGITIATAFLSLLGDGQKWKVRSRLAMTGEISLMGDVLPVGGIREKVVAAASAGIKRLILPERNKRDYAQVPDYIREKLEVEYVQHFDEVVMIAFPGFELSGQPSKRSKKK